MAGNQIKNVPNVFITINGKTFNTKNHLLSLTVERCIGDVANNFTLEVFDETAEDVEMLLMSAYPSQITVKYSNSPDGTYDEFTGSVFDYTTSWVGLHTMLSITGVLSSGSGMLGRIGKQTIVWVENATMATEDELKNAGISGAYHDPVKDIDTDLPSGSYEAFEDGKTVQKTYNCYPYVIVHDPIMEGYSYSNGVTPTWRTNQRVRPSDVFKRVINKLNSDYDPSVTLGTVEQTALIYLSSWNQEDVNMLDYIKNVLCENSITEDGRAGFQVIDTGSGFDFKPIDYNSAPDYAPLTLEYGKKNAEVISVSINVSGAVTMAGGAFDANGEYTVVSGALDDIYGDQISYQNLEGYVLNKYKDLDSTGKYVPNTGDSNKQPNINLWNSSTPKMWLNSSASESKLNISASAKWENIRNSVYEGEIKVWGRTGSTYAPRWFYAVECSRKKRTTLFNWNVLH